MAKYTSKSEKLTSFAKSSLTTISISKNQISDQKGSIEKNMSQCVGQRDIGILGHAPVGVWKLSSYSFIVKTVIIIKYFKSKFVEFVPRLTLQVRNQIKAFSKWSNKLYLLVVLSQLVLMMLPFCKHHLIKFKPWVFLSLHWWDERKPYFSVRHSFLQTEAG